MATVTELGTKARSEAVEWLTLSAYEGQAGEHTLSLSLLPNTTGESRKAEIKITCADTTITIVVEQKSTTQNGEKPDLKIFITPKGKITGGKLLGKETPKVIKWHITVLDNDSEDNSIYSTLDYYYQNNTFNITLPTPPAKAQGEFLKGVTVAPQHAKFSTASLDAPEVLLTATNIPWTECNLMDRLRKKGEGELSFFYCSEEAVVSGRYSNGEDIVFKANFNNCKFRKGWNEVAMIVSKDQTANGGIEFDIVVNKMPSSFNWISTSYRDLAIVSSIEEQTTIVDRPGTPQEHISTSESDYQFTYDQQARISLLSSLENPNKTMSITYTDNNVEFKNANQSTLIALNSNGYYDSHSLWGGGGHF